MIQTKIYPTKDLYLSKGVVTSYITKFWNDKFSKLILKNVEQHIMLLVKIQFSENDSEYRTLGHLRSVNFEDKEAFLEYIVERLDLLNDSYTTLSINKIIFTFIKKEGKAEGTRKLLTNIETKGVSGHNFNNMNLPATMIPSEYGKVLSKELKSECVRYIVRSSINKFYQIDVSLDDKVNNVTLLGASDLKWVDTFVSEGSFKREIGKTTIYFLDGEIIVKKQIRPVKYIKRLKSEKVLLESFVTMDVETIKQGNQLVPYLINAYNGSDHITSYANTALNQKVLFSSFFNKLLTFISSKSSLLVYAHNLSSFDGVFLLNHLIPYGEVKPLYHNGRLMSIKIKLNTIAGGGGYEGKTIIFKDSYLLFPYPLRNLCEALSIKVLKSYFPFRLNNINFIGRLPSFNYWIDITPEAYKEMKVQFKNKMWNFKDEAIKYCKLDCICLYEILSKINSNYFEKHQINIHSALTAPALSMRLYKTHYMPENTIGQISGAVEEAIRESYSGGAVDVYLPHNKIGSYSMSRYTRKLYSYDVNSLYPTVMAQQLMPVGNPIEFVGDIRKVEPKAFGFFFCTITSPEFLQHPILQRRVKTSEGTRTIAALGTWQGWICSTEMDNAMKNGYKFIIHNGYQFERGDIFSKFITTMYELRQDFPKGHPLNLTAKLMMNSLYGKFGMRNEFNRVDIYSINTQEDKLKFKDKLDVWGTTVKDFILLDNYLIVIRDSRLDLKNNPENEDSYHGIDTNIAIASTITSEARVYMSYLKNNPKFNLYYSDTDSVVISSPLPAELVGNALGQ